MCDVWPGCNKEAALTAQHGKAGVCGAFQSLSEALKVTFEGSTDAWFQGAGGGRAVCAARCTFGNLPKSRVIFAISV
jgi:hypothetical protein